MGETQETIADSNCNLFLHYPVPKRNYHKILTFSHFRYHCMVHSRRALLAVIGSSLPLLTGCVGNSTSDTKSNQTTDSRTENTISETNTATHTSTSEQIECSGDRVSDLLIRDSREEKTDFTVIVIQLEDDKTVYENTFSKGTESDSPPDKVFKSIGEYSIEVSIEGEESYNKKVYVESNNWMMEHGMYIDINKNSVTFDEYHADDGDGCA